MTVRADMKSMTETTASKQQDQNLHALLQNYWELNKGAVVDLGELVRLEAALAKKSLGVLIVALLCLSALGAAAWITSQLLIGLGVMSMGFSIYVALITVLVVNGVLIWLVGRQLPALFENLQFQNVKRVLCSRSDSDA